MEATVPDRRLLIKRPRTEFFLDEIIRIEGDSNYSSILLTSGKQILVSKTIWTLAAQLPEFIRIHKSHLVNPAFVATLRMQARQTSGVMIMTTGDVLTVAKRRKHDVRLLLRQYQCTQPKIPTKVT